MAHLVAIALALKPHGVARGLETGQRRQQACLCLVDTELQALAQLRLAQQPGRLRACSTRTGRTGRTGGVGGASNYLSEARSQMKRYAESLNETKTERTS